VCLSLGLVSTLPGAAIASTLVARGAVWRYLDNGTNQGTAWRAPTFSDASWALGAAQLGYGDGDETSVVSFGGNAANKYITTYFRHRFAVADPSTIATLTLRVLRDDGAVVYLNGVEVWRSNMPSGAIDYRTLASSAIGGADENVFHETAVTPTLLVAGDNVLAVEIHQANATSSDLSFDLELTANQTGGTPVLLRRPYLQVGTPTSMIVRWRTDVPSESRVVYGTSPENLSNTVTLPAIATEHEVNLTELAPATTYYYAVGTSTLTLAGGDTSHFFVTPPLAGTVTPLRIWVIGDSGECAQNQQGCANATSVREAYLTFAGTSPANVWLLLGDNAYNNGTDDEYTRGFFNVYPTILRNTVVWPSPGNHEFGASDSPTQSGPYYNAFTMPTQGQAGGVPSGTEAYYAFDYGNVHFIALDSHDTDRTVGGAMYTWLEADLQATSQDFVIVYWHHPPYTKGSHDSDNPTDSGGRMRDMRERFVPLLESYGVDLQLTGHSHSYERSMFIDGHYGLSSTFNPALHALDTGDGDPNGDGAYEKPTLGPVPHEGAVFSVVGSSSKVSSALGTHPVMVVNLYVEGSMVIDVNGQQLDGYFIDKNGTVLDHFRIVKGVPTGRPVQATFMSIANEDGWVRESGEQTNVGGATNTNTTSSSALRAGDDTQDRQYKFILSFDTAAIPDGATMTAARLELSRGSNTGTNPFTTHGTLYVDVHNGPLGGNAALQTNDFAAPASHPQAAMVTNQGGNGTLYTVDLSSALTGINKTGRTQMRVYFALDDNDDLGNDYAGFHSANSSNSAYWPRLIVTYIE
jgi:hypothetical protein